MKKQVLKQVILIMSAAILFAGCGEKEVAPPPPVSQTENTEQMEAEQTFLEEQRQLEAQRLQDEELRKKQEQEQEQERLAQQQEEEIEKDRLALEEERLRQEQQQNQQKNVLLIESQRVYFAFDSFEINEEGRMTLQKVANLMRGIQKLDLRIEGFCDERGTAEYNMALGERRARAVADFLIVLGVSPSRLHILSFGEENPLNPAHSEKAWAENRRAEFYFIK